MGILCRASRRKQTETHAMGCILAVRVLLFQIPPCEYASTACCVKSTHKYWRRASNTNARSWTMMLCQASLLQLRQRHMRRFALAQETNNVILARCQLTYA